MIQTHIPDPMARARRRPTSVRCIALGAAAWLIQATDAGAAADPTAPPVGWSAAPAPTAAQQPTTPMAVMPAAASGASLALVGTGRRVAVVNGQLVRQGDMIEGYRVIAVRTGSIVLQGGGGTRTLSLTPGIEIRPRPEKQP